MEQAAWGEVCSLSADTSKNEPFNSSAAFIRHLRARDRWTRGDQKMNKTKSPVSGNLQSCWGGEEREMSTGYSVSREGRQDQYCLEGIRHSGS